MKILLATLNARFFHVNLALHSIRSNEPSGSLNEVALKEYTINQDFKDILGELIAEKADVIGFSVYIWNKNQIFRIARLIKQINPMVKIVLGGPEVSYDPEDFLASDPWIDAIVIGEGEVSFWELIKSWETMSCEAVLGVAQQGEKERSHWEFQEIHHLNLLKFAYEKTNPKEIENRIAYYESSRGCPFSCSYCLSGLDGTVRNRSAELVTQELAQLTEQGVKQIKFVDRTFNADPNHFGKIISFLSQLERPLNFHFEMDAAILEERTVEYLSKLPTGRVQLEIGIQSTFPKTLQSVNRHQAFARESKIIRKLKEETDIHLHLDLIAGLPYEGLEEFSHSFDDVFALEPHQLQLGFLKMLRGSGIRKEAEEYGYVFDSEAPYEVMANRWLSAEELSQLRLIEKCLEELWNAGRLKKLIGYLIREVYDQRPFYFFKAISHLLIKEDSLWIGRNGRWWAERFFHEINRNPEWMPHRAELLDLLKWDIVLLEKGRWKPDFIQWQELKREPFWRDEEWVRKYIPDYQFKNWRDTYRQYMIETFSSRLFQATDEEDAEFMIQLEEPFKWWKIEKRI